jgi:hypothetical protein
VSVIPGPPQRDPIFLHLLCRLRGQGKKSSYGLAQDERRNGAMLKEASHGQPKPVLSSMMLKMPPSVVLSRSSPCNATQGYASFAELPAAVLGCHFEHPAGKLQTAATMKSTNQTEALAG